MTRNNPNELKQTQSPSTISTEDNITSLPDLSAFRDDEKQHILNVLVRDESLRKKHLSRFMNLRKEVADLEQQSQLTSTSICARCQTPFGYIFNTGDACPKCGAKVCKQCRLMYNVNDNSWLCQLCCKQMQLMSYSGEWIYSIHSNLRKNSKTESEILHDSLPLSASAQNINVVSSSDSEPEVLVSSSNKNNRFNTQVVPSKPNKPKKPNPNIKINKMIVQSQIDEQKLNFVKGRMKARPLHMSLAQLSPRRTREVASSPNTVNTSSDEINSLLNRSNNRQGHISNKQMLLLPRSTEVLTTNQNIKLNRHEVDCESITSSEWGGDNNKSKKDKLIIQRLQQSSSRDSKLSLASKTTEKASHKYLSVSMQSLRAAVHRIPHPHLSSSRTSLSPEKKHKSEISNSSINNDEDTISLTVPNIPSRSSMYHSFVHMYPTWSSG